MHQVSPLKSKTPVLRSGLLLGAEWVHESSRGEREHVNPSTGRVQATFPIAGVAEVDRAVEAARAAFIEWKIWKPDERRMLLERIADSIRANAAVFGEISAYETGMPYSPKAAEVAASWFDYYAGWVDKSTGEVLPVSTGGFDYTVPEPVGVIASITTWNSPIMSAGMTIAPALAAGCCVVLKPAELTPFSSVVFAELCIAAGLPSGVLTVVTGDGSTGDALVRHRGIDKVSFVGGLETARKIQAACSETVKPLVLELGGKSANIIFEDADIDKAAQVAARFVSMSGQGCTLPTRLLVQDSVYDRVIERLIGQLRTVVVGDPFAPGTTMGPVATEAACRRICTMIDDAKAAGARILFGGRRLGGDLSDGYFVEPTVIGDVDNRSEIAQHEVFGPVLTVIRFHTEDEAVALANDTSFGLAAYAHTRDLSRAIRLTKALHAASVHINGTGPGPIDPTVPFGGCKQSGFGKQGGKAGLEEFINYKNIHINF